MASRIGFIGLGVMGSKMARNLLKAGYEVVVYNRSRPAVEELLKEGAIAAGSPMEMARDCEIIVLCLSDSKGVEETVLGGRGLIHGFAPGGIVIDTSTIDLGVAMKVAAAMKAGGFHFLDAPVSGGPEGARAATLSIMVGGDRSAFARCEDVLNRMGKRVFYLGESGSGLKMKLFNQALVGVYFVAVAEAYLWSKKLGVKLEDLQSVISTSWGDSPPFRHFVSVVQSGEFKGGALIRNLKKDLSIVLDSAKQEGESMSLAELAQEYVVKASEMGRDDYDISYLFQILDEIKSGRRDRLPAERPIS
ncbi:MAG: NAD(P)-dependent oxidoreductase [Thaumarchaeota archaeon]|nr:NAD(P)-dependent oxidoreductase [Nitrososphaerota archaeon]